MDDTPQPAPPPPEPQPQNPDAPAYKHGRTGNVARLPKIIRDQVNQMLLDGVPYAKIIENLGDHGKDLNEDNIGNWKSGGYEDWLLELDRKEALSTTREAALGLVSQKAGATVQDAGRTIASAQIYELLLSFDPRAFAAALAAKPELYCRLLGALARISEGEAVCAHRRAQESLIGAKLNPPKSPRDPAAKPGSPAAISPETLKEIARLIKLL